MNLSKKQKYVAVGSAAIILAAGSGAAYAYWTNSGSGTGTAKTGDNNPVTITQTSVVTGLYPGGSAVNLVGTIHNGNSGPVYVNIVTPTITAITNTADNSASSCAATTGPTGNFTLTPGTVATDLATGDTTGQDLGTIKLNDLSSNQDACKNVTIALSYASN